MNKKNSELNRKKYTIPSGANYQLRSKNAIYISHTNSIRHELAKCIGAYQLRKWGEVNLTEEIVKKIKELEKETKETMKEFPRQSSDFITEAVPKLRTRKEKGILDKNRRIDLVDLRNNDWIEFETNKKIKKEHSITFYIWNKAGDDMNGSREIRPLFEMF